MKTGSMPVAIADRLHVHREIEWMRQHNCWPDELDFADRPLDALQAIGAAIPERPACVQLLLEEVKRELEHDPQVRADTVCGQLDDDLELNGGWRGSVDPRGELTGRVRMYQLLARRIPAGRSLR